MELYERAASTEPYLKGKFIITNLERQAPANDDVTYSITLENCGEPDVLDATKITKSATVE